MDRLIIKLLAKDDALFYFNLFDPLEIDHPKG